MGGCFEPKTKTFTKSGITITATDEFYEKELLSVTIYLESQTKIITGLKENKSMLSPSTTLNSYTNLVLTNNQLTGTEYTEFDEDDIRFNYFIYEREVSGKSFKYLAVTKEGADNFYLFNFACESKNYQKFEQDFMKWAKLLIVE